MRGIRAGNRYYQADGGVTQPIKGYGYGLLVDPLTGHLWNHEDGSHWGNAENHPNFGEAFNDRELDLVRQWIDPDIRWSDWISHNGGSCPVADSGADVQCHRYNDTRKTAMESRISKAGMITWRKDIVDNYVCSYRVIVPPTPLQEAAMQLQAMLEANEDDVDYADMFSNQSLGGIIGLKKSLVILIG